MNYHHEIYMLHWYTTTYKQDIFSFATVAVKDLGEDCESRATWFLRSGAGNGRPDQVATVSNTPAAAHCCTPHRISFSFFPEESVSNFGVSESEVNNSCVSSHLNSSMPSIYHLRSLHLDASLFLPDGADALRSGLILLHFPFSYLGLASKIRLGCVGSVYGSQVQLPRCSRLRH